MSKPFHPRLDDVSDLGLVGARGARRFPPPRIESGIQARAVRGALEAFLAWDESRFRRLFLSEERLTPAEAERPWMDVLANAGYVKPLFLGHVRPCVRVFFLDELLIATDLLAHRSEDQVFSLMLEQVFLVRSMDVRNGDQVLELCLGSGVNALAAARRGAARIVGVDVNERALAFARANAAVNLSPERGHAPLETLRGSLFEPLAAEDRFDLVLVNPPFELVPPDTRYFLHSHGGEDGLDLVRAMLPGVAVRLRSGGRFEMYTWTPGDEKSERVTDLVLAAFPDSASRCGAWTGGRWRTVSPSSVIIPIMPGGAAGSRPRASRTSGAYTSGHSRMRQQDSCGPTRRTMSAHATPPSPVGSSNQRSIGTQAPFSPLSTAALRISSWASLVALSSQRQTAHCSTHSWRSAGVGSMM